MLSATIHPDIKRTLVAMSKRTGMTVSQIADEVLYTGLIEMQELDAQRKVQLYLDYFKRPPHSQS